MTGGWIRVATVMCDGAEAGPTGFAVLTIQLRKILRVVMDHDLHAVFAKQPQSFNLKHGFSRVAASMRSSGAIVASAVRLSSEVRSVDHLRNIARAVGGRCDLVTIFFVLHEPRPQSRDVAAGRAQHSQRLCHRPWRGRARQNKS